MTSSLHVKGFGSMLFRNMLAGNTWKNSVSSHLLDRIIRQVLKDLGKGRSHSFENCVESGGHPAGPFAIAVAYPSSSKPPSPHSSSLTLPIPFDAVVAPLAGVFEQMSVEATLVVF